jgi:membrane protein YqaA with SNARE-associated domain
MYFNQRMWWQYVLVFFGAMAMDITPFPLPPAFTVMVFLQILFGLPIWPVVVVGVAGSIIGRYILTLYIAKVSGWIFNPEKQRDVEFLGSQMKSKGWRTQAFIIFYSLMPLPTTPLFIAAGMARLHPMFIVPAFFVGKFTSDAVAVVAGNYAAQNTAELLSGLVSWQSVAGIIFGALLICALVFIDWRMLLQQKRLTIRFDIWKKSSESRNND